MSLIWEEEAEEAEQEAELAKHDMPKAGGKQADPTPDPGPAGTAVDCRQDVSKNLDVTVIFALYKYVQWHVCEVIHFYFLKRMSAAISACPSRLFLAERANQLN